MREKQKRSTPPPQREQVRNRGRDIKHHDRSPTPPRGASGAGLQIFFPKLIKRTEITAHAGASGATVFPRCCKAWSTLSPSSPRFSGSSLQNDGASRPPPPRAGAISELMRRRASLDYGIRSHAARTVHTYITAFFPGSPYFCLPWNSMPKLRLPGSGSPVHIPEDASTGNTPKWGYDGENAPVNERN